MTDSPNIDLLLQARWIIPVVPSGRVLENCAIAIRNQRIVALVPQAEAVKLYTAKETVDLGEHVLIPGLINSHGHLAMSLLRGYADDKPLQEWLEQHIWPAEGQWVSERFAHDGTQLAMAEMIRAGTTCFSDMYFFPDATAAAAQQASMRANIYAPIINFPSAWAQSPEEYIHKALALHDDYRSSELISVGLGPHAPFTVADEVFERVVVLSEELQAPIHVHLHETAFEVEQGVTETGLRPTERLAKLGVLSPLTQCVHMTQVTEADIELIKEAGAHVIHCPESNLKLASGFCPVQQFMDAGINVAIGTDGAASNNDLDLLGELRTAAMLAKAVAQDAAALNAHQALAMATVNGAKACGQEANLGSLEVGKYADITAIRLDALEASPLYDVASHLVYTQNSHRVSDVWVGGKALLRDRKLQTLNEKDIRQQSMQWQQKISASH